MSQNLFIFSIAVRDIIAVTSGCPQDNLRTPLGWSPVTCLRHVPVVYSLYNPKGLTSSRIHLFYQSILFQLCPYNPLSIKSPHIQILPILFRRAAGLKTRLFVYIFIYIHYSSLKIL